MLTFWHTVLHTPPFTILSIALLGRCPSRSWDWYSSRSRGRYSSRSRGRYFSLSQRRYTSCSQGRCPRAPGFGIPHAPRVGISYAPRVGIPHAPGVGIPNAPGVRYSSRFRGKYSSRFQSRHSSRSRGRFSFAVSHAAGINIHLYYIFRLVQQACRPEAGLGSEQSIALIASLLLFSSILWKEKTENILKFIVEKLKEKKLRYT